MQKVCCKKKKPCGSNVPSAGLHTRCRGNKTGICILRFIQKRHTPVLL